VLVRFHVGPAHEDVEHRRVDRGRAHAVDPDLVGGRERSEDFVRPVTPNFAAEYTGLNGEP
jgi:hypothetical protein